MILARLSRLVLAALVVGGTLATPEKVCARHGGHEQPAVGEMHAHHGTSTDGEEPAPQPPCDRQTVAECCPMLMTCSFSFVADDAAETLAAGLQLSIPAAGRSADLLFRPATPDPPPPRA